MKNIFGLMIFVALAFAGCNSRQPVSQIHTFTNATWQRFEHLNFQLPVNKAGAAYDISVVIRYTKQFPAAALPVNLVMNTPGGEERIKDYNLYLKDKNGNFLGREEDGVYQITIPVRQGMIFEKTGTVKFDIENLMPKYYTTGIAEFGIVMEEAED